MQTDKTSPDTTADASAAGNDDEFSGLHDLKELATSARARSRRATSHGDSEIATLASTSASFKAVALTTAKSDPGVAVVVQNTAALAPKGDVPSVRSPLRAQGTQVEQIFASEAMVAEPAAAAATQADFVVPTVATSLPIAEQSRLQPATTPRRSRTWLAIGGTVIAIAAVAGVWVATKAPPSARSSTTAPAPAIAAQPAPAPEEPAVQEAAVAPTPAAPQPQSAVVSAPPQYIDVASGAAAEGKGAKEKNAAAAPAAADSGAVAAVPAAAVAAPVAKEPKSTGDKTIDDLLSDASSSTGIVDRDAEAIQKKADRTELSRGDIKKAFGDVQPAANACYKKFKEVGTVPVRVTVLPTGKVTKVVASGAFAGTPTGDCVVAAAKSASFPEWDGSQTTLSYSFLLGE